MGLSVMSVLSVSAPRLTSPAMIQSLPNVAVVRFLLRVSARKKIGRRDAHPRA
jgi:hypothetical protein